MEGWSLENLVRALTVDLVANHGDCGGDSAYCSTCQLIADARAVVPRGTWEPVEVEDDTEEARRRAE